jgi:hypothetical protein
VFVLSYVMIMFIFSSYVVDKGAVASANFGKVMTLFLNFKSVVFNKISPLMSLVTKKYCELYKPDVNPDDLSTDEKFSLAFNKTLTAGSGVL